MESQSSEQVVLRDFPLFKELPIEIRRMVWARAVPLFHEPYFIPLSFSNPTRRQMRAESLNSPVTPWKHMFFTTLEPVLFNKFLHERPVPLLLRTCSESRQAAKAFYTQGWDTKADGWGYSGTEIQYELDKCAISEQFNEEAELMYWKPETDVVYFQHEDEPYGCGNTLICNAERPCYGFWFDERIRFAAMSRAVFETGVADDGKLHMPNVEIVFVLVHEPRTNPSLREFGITDRLIQARFHRWKETKQQEWSSPQVTEKIFDCADRDEHLGRIEVKVITSLEQIWKIIADRPPRPAVVQA